MQFPQDPFVLKNPDFRLSPFSGVTRTHWQEAARWFLHGIFSHLRHPGQPLMFPKVPGKSYPNPDTQANDPSWKLIAAQWEALIRSAYIAFPLLRDFPNEEVSLGNGQRIRLRDYYREQLAGCVTPGHAQYIETPEKLDGTFFQMTCEVGGLAMTWLRLPEVIWPDFDTATRERLLELFSAWGHYRTLPHNWRWFNVAALSWSALQGRGIDQRLLRNHLENLIGVEVGQGWYRDGHFDYYTAWVFQLYGQAWNLAYGYQHLPAIAARLDRSFADYMDGFPRFFARDGRMIAWTRSICYRNAAAAVFPAAFFNQPRTIDPGFARRLATGALMQFITHPDFRENGVPALGFYGHFEPYLQTYSCSASPLWLGLAFTALDLPANSPFWTAVETEGPWNQFSGVEPSRAVYERPGLQVYNYPTTGASVIMPSKQCCMGDPHYARLAYHSDYPMEADNALGGSSMTYCVRNLDLRVPGDANDQHRSINELWWCGFRGGVAYRRAVVSQAQYFRSSVDLADFPVAHGIGRLDRCRVFHPHDMTLGHFALPLRAGDQPVVHRYEHQGQQAITVSLGDRHLALVAVHGWDTLEAQRHAGCSAEAPESLVLLARRTRREWFPDIVLLGTLLLDKRGPRGWTAEELFQVATLEAQGALANAGLDATRVRFTSPRKAAIDVNFDGFEGEWMG